MVRPEGDRPSAPEEKYQSTLVEFVRNKAAIFAAAQESLFPRRPNLWEKLGLKEPKTVPPLTPSPAEQTATLDREFLSWLHTSKERVVWHLQANPQEQESIIAGYLQSPELLQDENTFADFLAFWWGEFLQQPEAPAIESLPEFIKEANPNQLPRNLQKARKDIFLPLFKRLAGKEEKVFPPGDLPAGRQEEIELFEICLKLTKTLFDLKRPLPESLKQEYLAYVKNLIEKESGITPRFKPTAEAKPGKNKTRGLPFPLKPEVAKTLPETPLAAKVKLYIVLRPQAKPAPVENLETLTQVMKKIKNLGPIKPEDVWRRLERLRTLKPEEIPIFYKERVAGGPFMGWSKIALGLKWWILFRLQEGQISFRVGSHEDVYATGRRKPRDKSRSL